MAPENALNSKKKLTLPHIYVLLFGIIVLCTLLTWVLPAGEFDRVVNEAGRTVAVAGTYHTVESSPVGFFAMFQAIYNGFVNAGEVSFFVFISYASINIIISSGAFNGLVAAMLKILKGKARVAIIPVFLLIIGIGSSILGLFEEWFPFVPVFVGIAIAMGFDAIVGVAIVGIGAGMGYSGAMMNPFTVGVAQGIAEVAPMSGMGFRFFCHICMIIVASIFIMRYALKVQADPTKSVVYGDKIAGGMSEEELLNSKFSIREKLVLAVMAINTFMSSWNNFFWPFLVTNDPAMYTIQVGLKQFKFANETLFAPMMAGATISALPMFVMFFSLQKYFMEGVTIGAVKG